MDVLDMLKKDHQTVTKLFQRFKDEENARARSDLAQKICEELDVHARLEEELFYPVVEEVGDAELAGMVGEARREHEQVKEQCRTITAAVTGGQDDGLEAQVAALERDVEQHVTEEEGEMFPQVEEVIDAAKRSAIAQRAQARKRQLTSETTGARATGATATRSGTTKRRQSAKRKRTKSTKTAKRAKTTKAGGRATTAKKRARGGRR